MEIVAWQRILTSADTIGEVTGIVVGGCYGDDGCDHTVFVSFDAGNGQSYEFTTSDSGYPVGQSVSVTYVADNPQDASVGSKDLLWVPPLLLLGALTWIPFCLVRKKS
jgi:hypothetical protein